MAIAGQLQGFSNVPSISHCFSCLSRSEEKQLQIYYIQQATLKSILQTEQIILCYICNKLAKNAEQFLNNVETAHYFVLGIKDVFKENVEYVIKPIVSLTVSPIELIELGTEEEQTHNVGCEDDLEQLLVTPEEDVKLEFLKVEETVLIRDVGANSFNNEIVVEDENISEFTVQDSDMPAVEYKSNAATSETKKVVQDAEIDLQKQIDSMINIIKITKYRCLNELALKRKDAKFVAAEFKCIDCVKRFTNKPNFAKHMERHKASGDYVCEICSMRFECDDELQLHIESHLRKYQCAVCDLVNVKRDHIERHILFTHPVGSRMQCPKCKRIFENKSRLKNHLRIAHQEPVDCGYCDRLFASMEYLRVHIKKFHSSKPALEFPCGVCGKSLESSRSLKVHMNTHSNKRDFYCVECNKYFKTQPNLDNHYKQSLAHTAADVQNHPCSICKKIFRTKFLVTCHMKNAHQPGARRLCCDHCGKVFRYKSSLVFHIQQHMGLKRARNFVCVVCDKAFYTQSNLATHRNTHTGATPFRCPLCPARFGHSASLHNHKRLVHERKRRTNTKLRPAGKVLVGR